MQQSTNNQSKQILIAYFTGILHTVQQIHGYLLINV